MVAVIAAALAEVDTSPDPKGPVVADGVMVSVHFTLRGPTGTVVRTTRAGAPITYLRGPMRLLLGSSGPSTAAPPENG